MSNSVLIIGDAHCKPGVSNRRFEWLGKYIVDKKPDTIVCIGDFADMSSLCSYDKGKKSFEGRRYKEDCDVTHDAQVKLFGPIVHYNQKQKKLKKPKYNPYKVMIIGNHENRIHRVVEYQSELEGTIQLSDLGYTLWWDEVVPFLEPKFIDGVCYQHYFTSGLMGRPIGGDNAAASMLSKQYVSCVAGHSHLRDFSERTRADGIKIQGLVVGCYLDPEQREDYAGPANSLWWKGVVMLHNVNSGQYDPEFVSIDYLRKRYEK